MTDFSTAILTPLFASPVYRADGAAPAALIDEIEQAARSMMIDDEAGINWCVKNRFPGYTSYASLNDLPWRFPAFKTLAKLIDGHVTAFAKALHYDLGGRRLVLDSLWVNVLPEGGHHAAHIHPRSTVSGTFYVAVPKKASAIRFEDPRLAMMMAAPPRRKSAPETMKTFVEIAPARGTLLLWESFLRHDVPPNGASSERISVSFNHRWG